jgi:hypothetical protein
MYYLGCILFCSHDVPCGAAGLVDNCSIPHEHRDIAVYSSDLVSKGTISVCAVVCDGGYDRSVVVRRV